MPDKFKISNRVRNLMIAIMSCLFVVVCATSIISLKPMVGRPFPGFLLMKNNIVAIIWLPEWAGFRENIKQRDIILEVDDESVSNSSQVYEIVGKKRENQPVTYTISRGIFSSHEFEKTVPATVFTSRDFYIIIVSGLFIGILFMVTASVVFYLKPNSPESLIIFIAFSGTAIVQVQGIDICARGYLDFMNLSFLPGLGGILVLFALFFPVEIRNKKNFVYYLVTVPPVFSFLYNYLYYDSQVFYWRMVDVVQLLHNAFLLLVALFLMTRSFIKSRDPLVRQRAKVLVYGFIIFITLGMGIFAAIFIFGVSGNYFLVGALSFVLPLSLGYSVAVHNLFDVDVVIRRSLSYLLVTGIVIVLFLFVIALFSLGLQGVISDESSPVAAVATTLLMVLIFRPLRNRIDNAIDRRFFRGKYQYRETIQKASEVLVTIIDLDELLNKLVDSVLDAIQIEQGGLMLRQDDPDRFDVAVARGYGDSYQLEAFNPDHPIVRYLESGQRAIQINDVQELEEFSEHRELILSIVDELGLVLVIPILYEQRLIGIFGLAAKKSGAWYSSEDIALLQTLMNHTAVAIENAKKVEQLKRMIEVEASYNKLRELDQLKTDFFANISHELRTPLTMCLAPIEALISGERGQKKEERLEYLQTMRRNMLRLLNLINNLLDFSKLEAGRMKARVQEEDIGSLARYMVGSVESWAERRGIDISCATDKGLPPVFVDREKIDKVLLNLLSNAIKFTDKGGRIRVRVDKLDDLVEVSVSDTGVGIPTEAQQKIFDRFAQVDEGASREYEGTGIGLALVKEFVEIHGGSVWVESAPDQGSTFRFSLPLGKDHFDPDRVEFTEGSYEEKLTIDRIMTGIETAAGPGQEQAPSDDRAKAESEEDRALVLVVEDNVDMRRFVSDILSDRFRVETAVNGEEGLEKARVLKPDLVLSDVMMPKKDGYELCRDLKTDPETRNIPVILVTARVEMSMKLEGLEIGADDYLIKPFNAQELSTRVGNLVRYREAERKMREAERTSYAKTLGRFIPPTLVNKIIDGNEDILSRTSRKRLTVFFSDVRGFTSLSEEMEPEETIELLNHYFREMNRIIDEYEGTLDKFMGDGIMVFFNDPLDQPDHAGRAVKMGLAMQKRMDELQEQWFKAGRRPLAIGIGINTGYVTVGGIGSERHMDYTVIGNQVNLAARLQAMADGGEIIISHATCAEVADLIEVLDQGEVSVKGLHQQVRTYKVTGLK